jgi:phenylalanyl-tRNA synthetase alpha subunit
MLVLFAQIEIVLAVSQSKSPREFLRDRRLRELYDQIKSLPPVERGPFGKRINELKQAVEQAIAARLEELEKVDLKPIDVTAPMDVNSPKPELLPSEQGTIHPLSAEIERISEIFNRMGFVTEESREIDDQFHMFESLNFPKGHPARDDYDTFMTGYGFLPDFTESMWRPIQNYREQVIKRIEEWGTIQEQIDKPYIPPVVVGWNASPCEGKHFRDIQGMYPFTPITAWNEITEGAALLSKILPDGSVDNSYLAKIRELRDEYGF